MKDNHNVFPFITTPFVFYKDNNDCFAKNLWWRWVESNYRSIGYEPIALTAEPHRHVEQVKNNKKNYICQGFFKKFFKILIFVKNLIEKNNEVEIMI